MLVFIAVGALLGLPISRYDHGPPLYYRAQYTLVGNPLPAIDLCWPDKDRSLQETVAETLSSAEMTRRTLARMKNSDLRESECRIVTTAEPGLIPHSLVITIKTRNRRLINGFMDALVTEYLSFRSECLQRAGMSAEKAKEQLRLVEIRGNELHERAPIDPLGPVLGIAAGFACFVFFQVWRGDY